MKRIVIILGMHRSGTSVITQICQSMGVYLGKDKDLMEATQYNRSGFFENKEVTRIDDEILRLCNREWYSLEPLTVDFENPEIIERMVHLESILSEMLTFNDVIGIKDPRMVILLPLWKKIFDKLADEVIYIWEFRNPLEVAESLKTRDGFSQRHGLLLWINYNLNILEFLKEEKYLLINYRDILEGSHIFYDLAQLLDQEMDDELIEKLNLLVKHEYCHSNFTNQIMKRVCGDILPDLYEILLNKKEKKADITKWKKEYLEVVTSIEKRYMDFEVLEDINYLRKKEIIIYGAGKCGKKAAEMLRQLEFFEFDFCDKSINKQGTNILGGNVYSIAEIEKRENLLIIIAVENENLKKEIQQTLVCINRVEFLSFYTLKKLWKYFVYDYTKMDMKLELISDWYRFLSQRLSYIKETCENSILFFQCGTIGSTSVLEGLKKTGIHYVYIQGFFFENDIIKRLTFDGEEDCEKKLSTLDRGIIEYIRPTIPEYIKRIKNNIQNKKIIVMVGDPIDIDLSIVFQWMESEISNAYFSEQLKNGYGFAEAILNRLLKVRNELFKWFDNELRELSEINVFDYPFDRNKGFSTIKDNGIEILLFKVEKLFHMKEVIQDFTGSQQFEILNENMCNNKECAYLYEKVKKNIVLPDEYVDFYFEGNPQVSHFYSDDEREAMKNKWKKKK